jgi:hypothetical protein
MPREAPVTIATLLLSWVILVLLIVCCETSPSLAKKWTFSLDG